MGYLFITGKSVSWEPAWDLVISLLRTLWLADSLVPLNLASIRTWQQNGGMEGVVREDVRGTGMVPSWGGAQHSGSLTYFYLISSYCLIFFLKWSLANGLVSEAHLCLLPMCLLNLHTELENNLSLLWILPILATGTHFYTPKKCSYAILLRTGIPVWGSVPPYLLVHLCLERPLPITAWKVRRNYKAKGCGH